MNSGDIFGPPESESKKRIMPIAEEGPAPLPALAFGFSNFIKNSPHVAKNILILQ